MFASASIYKHNDEVSTESGSDRVSDIRPGLGRANNPVAIQTSPLASNLNAYLA